MISTSGRSFDQPERDWLHQLRRRRAIWLSISFLVLVVTVLGLFNLFSRRQPQPPTSPAELPTFVVHGRNAGGAAAQLLISAFSPESDTTPLGLDPGSELFPGNPEAEEIPTGETEDGPEDAPFLRRKTLTSADVMEMASRYFLPDDVVGAIRLAWCLSRFDPQAVDPLTGRVGLFQHDPAFWPDHAHLAGFRGYDPFDPVANTAVAAYLVYEGEGWQTWNCPS